MCHVTGTNGQLSYLVWQSWNHIYFSSFLLAEPLPDNALNQSSGTVRQLVTGMWQAKVKTFWDELNNAPLSFLDHQNSFTLVQLHRDLQTGKLQQHIKFHLCRLRAVWEKRENAQTIHIHYTYMTSLQSSPLHSQPPQKFNYFMPLYNRMILQVLSCLQQNDCILYPVIFSNGQSHLYSVISNCMVCSFLASYQVWKKGLSIQGWTNVKGSFHTITYVIEAQFLLNTNHAK